MTTTHLPNAGPETSVLFLPMEWPTGPGYSPEGVMFQREVGGRYLQKFVTPMGSVERIAPHSPGDVLAVGEDAFYWTGGEGGTSDVAYLDDPELKILLRDQSKIDQWKKDIASIAAVVGNWERKPASTMPSWAARKFFTVTDIRPVDLREVSEEDAIAAGFEGWADCRVVGNITVSDVIPPRTEFRRYWTDQHPDDPFAYAWRVAGEMKGSES